MQRIDMFYGMDQTVETIYIYNPALGEIGTVPCPKTKREHYYIFRFCPIKNQYKLLAIRHPAVVSVYTLGSHQGWRLIRDGDDQNYIWRNLDSHVCGRGDIYWINSYTNPHSISRFNLAAEELGSLPIPPIGDGKWIAKLSYLDHSLIATVKTKTRTGTKFDMELWVWKHSSWTKNWALPGAYTNTQVVPTKIFADGWILMLVNGEFLYLSSTKQVRHVDYTPYLAPSLMPYSPTLVSPKELMDMETSLYDSYRAGFIRRLFGSCGMPSAH